MKVFHQIWLIDQSDSSHLVTNQRLTRVFFPYLAHVRMCVRPNPALYFGRTQIMLQQQTQTLMCSHHTVEQQEARRHGVPGEETCA